ncbi:DUF1304 family protein [Oceanicola sp. 22II-s10i]|uniref:DUF1304 family protein n=1 Tax=Oceanicola sp. 22II-s10i TaxID=1317116 RepID=UPI000B526341|nr:DUF1304 domain-containing protein [Oceanicola sp. 22II-s10i]
MSTGVTLILLLIAALHVIFFIGESFLWKRPDFSRRMMRRMKPDSALDPAVEAKALEVLFFNQGVYNLMLALGAVWAIVAGSVAFAAFICLFVVVAGATLAATSRLRAGAVVQALPGLIGLILLAI